MRLLTGKVIIQLKYSFWRQTRNERNRKSWETLALENNTERNISIERSQLTSLIHGTKHNINY
jgi:hypothetical protein